MSRSAASRLRAGALCLTATTTAALAPAVADAAEVGVSAKRLNIKSGSRVTVKGRVAAGHRETAGPAPRALGDPRPDRTDAAGRYVLRKRIRGALSTRPGAPRRRGPSWSGA